MTTPNKYLEYHDDHVLFVCSTSYQIASYRIFGCIANYRKLTRNDDAILIASYRIANVSVAIVIETTMISSEGIKRRNRTKVEMGIMLSHMFVCAPVRSCEWVSEGNL